MRRYCSFFTALPEFCGLPPNNWTISLRDALSAERGMAEMSKKFLDLGANVYVDADKVKESNRVL